MARKTDSEPEEEHSSRSRSSGSSSSGTSVTDRPFVQKAFGIIILLAIVGFVGYLLYKSGALQKIPFLKNLLPK